jgi:hypothetical protein
MKRSHFLIITALLAWAFGVMFVLAPDALVNNLAASSPAGWSNLSLNLAAMFFAVGFINLLSSSDPGSKALKAVMMGNIILHLVSEGFDIYNYSKGYVEISSIMTGSIVHIALLIGFINYLVKIPKTQS